MNAILKEIRTDLRLSMNGIVSTSMREKGMNYGLNFGVDILKLRQIAKKYTADVALAETLYKENTRELKILATMLYPVQQLSDETADEWCRNIPNQEIREQICMNLFQNHTNAVYMAQRWISHADQNIRTTGYWLLTRLFITRHTGVEQLEMSEILQQAGHDLDSESVFLRQAALNVLKFYGRASKQQANIVLRLVNSFEHTADDNKREMFELLRFEFSLID